MTPAPGGSRHRTLVAAFTIAIFVNAALLFSVQPMFTKMVLPLLGGTPSVWNSCMLFFQVALLGGYLYAHLTTRALAPARQATLHLALLAAALLTLPVAVRAGWAPPTGGAPIPWLVGLLAVSLGLPFFALSAGAPMLQRWFASTSHPNAANPYFLYAASNLGSLVALLGYPLLVEPRLRLSEQSRAWSWGYWALALLVGVCALLARRAAAYGGPATAESPAGTRPLASAIRPLLVGRWIVLALVPSSLLLGVTTFLSTDIAAIPLLWVVPLSLYLLTFVVAFATRPPIPHWLVVWLQPALTLPLVVLLVWGTNRPLWLLGGLHLLVFFVTSLMCHGELARTRPPAEQLTAFYLWISVGGALGGAFNVLLAPLIFDTVVEYPIAIVAAATLLPAAGLVRRPRWAEDDDGGAERGAPRDESGEPSAEGQAPRAETRAPSAPSALRAPRSPLAPRTRILLDLLLPLLLGAVSYAATRPDTLPAWLGSKAPYVLTGLAAAVCYLLRGRPLRFALGVAATLVGGLKGRGVGSDVLFADRSFFGAYKVRQWYGYHHLTHGTTLHGAQNFADSARRLEPLTYYHRAGPLGQLFASLPNDGPPRAAALVGLGTGTTLCYGRPQDSWTIYEIDPLIVRIAQDRGLFTYLSGCAPAKHLRLGDARLRLAEAAPAAYDVIVLDAFSSDAIPAHLVTREALQLYLAKLAPGGIIAYHISNRYLNLRPVLSELARDARLAGLVGTDLGVTAQQRAEMKTGSVWVLLARRATDFASLARQSTWTPLAPRADVRLWTDDFTDVLGVFQWR
jgi:hypothetical protein